VNASVAAYQSFFSTHLTILGTFRHFWRCGKAFFACHWLKMGRCH